MQTAKIEFAPKRHSQTGASGLHRWRADRCPGSVRMIRENAPPELDIADEVRDDGVEAHGYSDLILSATDDSDRAAKQAQFFAEVKDTEMRQGVMRYVNYVRTLATLPGAILLVEEHFDLSAWLADGLYGTADAVVFVPDGTFYDLETEQWFTGSILHVIDFKYGFKRVNAEENDQALYYALGAYHKARTDWGRKVDRIVLHIFSPRVKDGSGSVDIWSCDERYLERFALRLKDDKIATEDPNAPLRANADWCRLCKARTVCQKLAEPAYAAWRLESINKGADPNTIPTLGEFMNDKALQYEAAKLVAIWAAGVKERTEAEIRSGHPVRGLKMVRPRGASYLVNVPEILERHPPIAFPALYETPDLKSPAQILSALKESPFGDAKDFESRYVRKSYDGKPLVVPVTDPRPEWSGVQNARDEWAEDIQQQPQAPAVPESPSTTEAATTPAVDTLALPFLQI